MPKLLLVEDNEENREFLSRRLRRRGYDVVIATDGRQGVDMASSESPDLVLMDLNMPVLDGWQATKILRAQEGTQDLPVIGLTAHAMSGDREKALEAGCNDYHPKPIDFPQLLEKIEILLRRSLEK